MLFQTIVSEYAVVTCYTHPSRVQKSRKTERKSVKHETLHYTGRKKCYKKHYTGKKSVIQSIIQGGKMLYKHALGFQHFSWIHWPGTSSQIYSSYILSPRVGFSKEAQEILSGIIIRQWLLLHLYFY